MYWKYIEQLQTILLSSGAVEAVCSYYIDMYGSLPVYGKYIEQLQTIIVSSESLLKLFIAIT